MVSTDLLTFLTLPDIGEDVVLGNHRIESSATIGIGVLAFTSPGNQLRIMDAGYGVLYFLAFRWDTVSPKTLSRLLGLLESFHRLSTLRLPLPPLPPSALCTHPLSRLRQAQPSPLLTTWNANQPRKPPILLNGWLKAQQMRAEVLLYTCRYYYLQVPLSVAFAYPLGRLHEYAYVSSSRNPPGNLASERGLAQ